MDKEITVDGVDVSKCIHYKNQSCIADYLLTGQDFSKAKCAYSPDCYFKQLQKEKFENLNNRQMVESAENLIYENSELYKNLKEKEQECEHWKHQAELGSDTTDRLSKQLEQKDKECILYKQALDEINNYIVYMKTFGDEEDTIKTIQKIIIQTRGDSYDRRRKTSLS